MNPLALILFIICGIATLVVPRSKAALPLLIGCCYITIGQGINLGMNLPFYRLLLIIGVIRVIVRNESITGGINSIDKIVILFSIWSLFASLFHEQLPGSGFKYTIGTVANVSLTYYLFRCWAKNLEEIIGIISVLAIILTPVAIEMLMEKATGKNLFSVFGGVPENVGIRHGKLRAQGPFRHAILAGTVGSVCFPLFVGIWNHAKSRAILGMAASFTMVMASASSGPLMSLIFSITALLMWYKRNLMSLVRKMAIVTYIALMFLMERPPYYLISKIDLTGSSTGWHRSRLIEQTISHFNEWFLFGTDRTRHWMPGQGAISAEHTDITNYYISFAVSGGLIALICIIAELAIAFKGVGRVVSQTIDTSHKQAFFAWSLGAGMFAHAATSISVAYFDQSLVFYWLNLALISSCMTVYSKNLQPEELVSVKTN